ncbi:SIS domain-containing protein [Novosphingobium sp. FSY-8]|uniref:SIS domain-containing protein n=2 Tax=Novosphingobium ovatum TaxID=1908523 RepID=A0ABW9XCE8_9SPHN|nr:SIS domain-containing protein [Novosphingobium ovatum]
MLTPVAAPTHEWALDVLRGEMEAIASLMANPPPQLTDAIHHLAGVRLPVLCCGVGKSGLVAAKVAATMSSLGIPAFTLSAGDAAHGDLGAVNHGSTVLMFSNSGTTTELIRLLPGLRARGCQLIGIVGHMASPLGQAMHILLHAPILREADHLNMAPTASTTLHMALGDALAVAVSRLRGFGRDDFLQTHPAGQLGHSAQPVRAIMRGGEDLPRVLPHMALSEAIAIMSTGRMGAACVVDWEDRLLGLIVDGDIRRAIQGRADIYAITVGEVMRRDPVCLSAGASVGDAVATSRAHGGLLVLPVTDDAGHLLGMVHGVDLVQN